MTVSKMLIESKKIHKLVVAIKARAPLARIAAARA